MRHAPREWIPASAGMTTAKGRLGWRHRLTHAMRAASFQHEQGRPPMIVSRKRRPRTGTGLA